MATKSKTTKSDRFPLQLHVEMQDGGDGEYFAAAYTSLEGIDDGTRIGIYKLVEVKTVRVKTELV